MSLSKDTAKPLSKSGLVEESHNLNESSAETPNNEATTPLGRASEQQIERQALNESHPPNGHASTTPSSQTEAALGPNSTAANGKQPASESHTPKGSSSPKRPSSLKHSIELSDDEEEKAPIVPKNVGFAEHHEWVNYDKGSPPSSVGAGQTLGSGNSPINSSDNVGWLLIPVSKGIQTLTPAEAARLKDPRSFDKIYIVFKDRAPLEHADPWDQVLSDVQGVYQTEVDANNKVISLYESEKVNIRHNLELRMKGQGSQFYGYETTGSLEDAPIVRVHVQQWNVTADMKAPERVPARRPKTTQKVKSMVDID
jgi:hypothetical protein